MIVIIISVGIKKVLMLCLYNFIIINCFLLFFLKIKKLIFTIQKIKNK
jgi:hypothetical protein